MVLRFIKVCQFLLSDSATQSFNILESSCFQHFHPIFQINLCGEPYVESSQTSTRLIIWSFPFWAEFPGLSTVTVLEAAVWRCYIKKFAKFCKIQRKTLFSESLFDAVFWVIEVYKSKTKFVSVYKFVNWYSARKRAHLYCNWANFEFSISSSHLNLVYHCSAETFTNLSFNSSTWIHTRNLSFLVQAGFSGMKISARFV